MTDHTEGRVAALADAFKTGWHHADGAGLPDRTHHGIRALLASAELADLIAWEIHQALERAAEAVRLSQHPPRIILPAADPGAMTLDGTFLGVPTDDITVRWGTPERLPRTDLEPYIAKIRDVVDQLAAATEAGLVDAPAAVRRLCDPAPDREVP